MTERDQLAGVVADVIRARVHPLASVHVGHTVIAGLEAVGVHVVRGRYTVNGDWLVRILDAVDHGPTGVAPDNVRAAAYDRLVSMINAHGRGRI